MQIVHTVDEVSGRFLPGNYRALSAQRWEVRDFASTSAPEFLDEDVLVDAVGLLWRRIIFHRAEQRRA